MTSLKNRISELLDNSQYDDAANLAAKELNVNLQIVSSKIGKMEWDKDNERRIFKLFLTRDGKCFSFQYGQSIKDSCSEKIVFEKDTKDTINIYVGISSQLGKISGSIKFDIFAPFKISDIDIEKYGKELKTNYDNDVIRYNKNLSKFNHIGFIDLGACHNCILNAIRRETEKTTTIYIPNNIIINPTFYDVFTCLTKYDVGTFDNFCDNFGYDNDSITALKTYKQVVKEYKQLSKLFTSDELELLNLIN